MNKSQPIPLISLALSLACLSCLASPGDPWSSEHFGSILTAVGPSPGLVTGDRGALVLLAGDRIAQGEIGSGRLAASPSVTATVADGEEELVSLLISCALPARLSVVAMVAGLEFDFPGEIGLASGWARGALDPRERRWVSACVAAKISGLGVFLPISLRGPRSAIAAPRVEREDFPLEEGAFFGDVFVPADEPVDWSACRGRGQIPTPAGGLVDLVCAEEDPARPGLTRCGFFFAGECASACDLDPERGFYLRCRSRGAFSSEIVTAYASP